jgi:hypothetical protein
MGASARSGVLRPACGRRTMLVVDDSPWLKIVVHVVALLTIALVTFATVDQQCEANQVARARIKAPISAAYRSLNAFTGGAYDARSKAILAADEVRPKMWFCFGSDR